MAGALRTGLTTLCSGEHQSSPTADVCGAVALQHDAAFEFAAPHHWPYIGANLFAAYGEKEHVQCEDMPVQNGCMQHGLTMSVAMLNRLDGDWHHIAATWEANSGETALYFDGERQTPFWRATGGRVEQEYPSSGGVDNHLAWGTDRQNHGKQLNHPCDVLFACARWRNSDIGRMCKKTYDARAAWQQ